MVTYRRDVDSPRATDGVEVQFTYSPRGEARMRDWSDRPAMATFDLHGQTVSEGAVNAERFLRAQQRARRGGVVRLITGRGRAGGGAPLRTRMRTLLRALRDDGSVIRDYFLEETEGSFLVRLAE